VAITLTYTDEQGATHTAEATVVRLAGSTTLATTATTAARYYLVPFSIRCNPNTTVSMQFTNGSASNVFDAEATCDWLPE